MSDPLSVSRKEIAKLLGVSLPTVTDWVDRGMPVVQEGSRGVPWEFDVAECFAWRLNHELAKATDRGKDVTREEAERRTIIADARLKEIKLAQELGDVVKVSDVTRVWEGRIVAARETFQNIAPRLAPILVGEEDQSAIEQQIEHEVDAALRELASWEPDEPPEDDDQDEPEKESKR